MQWVTTTQVLEALKGSNEPAWQQFCDYFHPIVANFARKLGLSATDAEDAAQETMVEFLKAFRNGKYDREQGRLCNWLLGVAKRVILNLRGNRPLERLIADKTTGTSFWDMIKDDHSIKHTWDTEWRRMVLTRCLEQARRETSDDYIEYSTSVDMKTPGYIGAHVTIQLAYLNVTETMWIEVQTSLDGTNWDDDPVFSFRIESTPNPNQISCILFDMAWFRLAFKRDTLIDFIDILAKYQGWKYQTN